MTGQQTINCPGQSGDATGNGQCGCGKRKAIGVWCQESTSAKCEWSISFADVKRGRRKTVEVLDQIHFHELELPYVTNVTAEPITDICKTKELLKEQVAASVRWQQSMERMIEDGVDTFYRDWSGKDTGRLFKRRSIERSRL